MFLCGSSSLSRVDDIQSSTNLTPKGSKRATSLSCSRTAAHKNPYADRGLDKFYSLLADLDDKKQKIYKEMGSEDISFVRFVYDHGSDQVKPIIVKVKDKKDIRRKDKVEIEKAKNIANFVKHSVVKVSSNQGDGESKEETVAKVEVMDEKKGKEKKSLIRCSGSFRMHESLRHPHYHLVVMVVLVMLFLLIFGRSFAVLCTSIGWFLVPSVVRGSSYSNERKSKNKTKKKKIHHAQNEGSSSPKSVISGLID